MIKNLFNQRYEKTQKKSKTYKHFDSPIKYDHNLFLKIKEDFFNKKKIETHTFYPFIQTKLKKYKFKTHKK